MSSSGRVLVIGAGHNGLVCAIRLAESGIPVTVLEHRSKPGGAVGSHEATRPGFVHDHCAGFFPLSLASPALRDLPLERHGLEWVNPSVCAAHPFLDGEAVALHRDVGATVASLDAAGPGAGQAWRELIAPLMRHQDTFIRAILGPFPPVVPGLKLAAVLRRDGIDLARLMGASAIAFGEEVFGHQRPTAWFCGSAMHSDLDPGAAGSSAFGLFLMLLGHYVGWPYPRGGAGRLTDALVAHLTELGGEVRCDAHVDTIEVRRGRAAGVRLSDGDAIDATEVVAALTATPLARMLPDDALPARLMTRLRKWRYGVGSFKLDYALDGPVPWTSDVLRQAGVVHVGEGVDSLQRAAQEAGRGELPGEPAMIVGQHTLEDPTRAPEGKHTLYVYTHVMADVAAPDEEVAERMEARIEEFAPGFRNLVIERTMTPPRQLERDNPSLLEGDVGGGSYTLDQQLVFRPAPEMMRYRTPLRGLYVGSSSVHPGGGVHGMGGAGAARALIADRSPVRFWR